MKRCKQCNRTYEDDSLNFCLEDGTVLVRVSEKPLDLAATLLYPSTESTKVIPPANVSRETPSARSTQTDEVRPNYTRSVRVDGSSNRVLTAGVVVIGLALLSIAAILVVFLWRQMRGDQGTAQSSKNDGQLASSAPPQNVNSRLTPTLNSNIDSENVASQTKLTINVTASSVRYSVQSNTYLPANVVDNARKTAWIEGADGPGLGEWLRFDFGREVNLHRIVILPGYFKSADIWKLNNRLASATLSFSDGSSRSINFPDRMERQTFDLGSVKTRWVRLEIGEVYAGSDPDTAISEVVFEWEP
jgi:hypothetical protein